MTRELLVDGLVNARDLGGLPLVRGGTTPRGVVFRSENLDRVTDAGWASLRAAGIRTVIDLRQPSEIEAAGRGPRPTWLTTVEIDHDGLEDTVFWADYWETGLVGTALYYLPHLDAMPERTGAVLAAIANAGPGGVLFHCAGGRDRTGIVALALLSVVGVRPETIVDDYLATVSSSAALFAAMGRPDPEPRIEELCRARGTTNADAFRATVAGFDVERFVDRSGLTDVELEALRTWRGTLT
ncbi:tyrosine-protein phosphatase [Curtobacterium sp. Leaf261]|uniref:tyrosine-protein phosphatase n=1 Tax=Curtobacterium sp. Leaf261 TaxID=1736311 RepID=UPI0006F656EE|nr:tyrosine-protein phosphatase [Curtobacterium sp. Leaf261]KQO63786.1 tyrosine protein phosphatase [Curtobacterium sp. Leaf261]